MFLLNVPVAAGALVLGARFVEDLPKTDKAPLDWFGAVLATAGLAGLTWGLTLASGQGGWAAPAAIGIGAGGLLIAWFLWHERRRGADAMMPLDLFTLKVFVGLSLVTFMLYGGLGGLLHSGIASGYNSAVARTGGLIATALASAILVAHAQSLESAFHGAMMVGAATAAAASASAFLCLAPTQRGEDIMSKKTCSHLDTIQAVQPGTRGCEECLALGVEWMHLRLCRTCGHVGCCDESPLRHATKHFQASGHPIIEGYDPPEGWGWCFKDKVMIDLGANTTPQDGPIPRFY